MEPRDRPHAPRTNRLVSGCSPNAAGSIRTPMNPPSTPAAIIQLPVCGDIFGAFLAECKLSRRNHEVSSNCEHSEFFGLTPDDESHPSP